MTRGRYDALARALCGDTRRGHRDGDYCQRCTPISDALARAHAEGLEAGLRQAAVAVAHAREHYSTDIFEADGISLECCQARWARNLLSGIISDIDEIAHTPGSLIPAAPEVIK